MRVVIEDEGVAAQLIRRRRELGLDLYDEVRGGVYHVVGVGDGQHGRLQAEVLVALDALAPRGLRVVGPVNIGTDDDYRVPDVAVISGACASDLYFPSAALIAEVFSGSARPSARLAFYASRGVPEVLLVHATERRVTLLVLRGGEYVEASGSAVLERLAGVLSDQAESWWT